MAGGSRRWVLLARLAAGLLLGSLGACSSSPRASSDARAAVSEKNRELTRGALTAVEIHGQPLETVMETTEGVFTDAGFSVSSRRPGELAFDRAATAGQVAAYGNWQGMEVRIRLRVRFLEYSSGHVLAVCRSYVAREAGTPSEDEQPLGRARVRRYEALLHEVANRLN